MIKLARRMERLGAEGFSSVQGRAAQLRAQGRPLVEFHVGEPDFDTPAVIIDSAVSALRGGATRYAPAAGHLALREAVAADVQRSRCVVVGPEQVVIAPGAKPMIYFALLALCEAGDEVICPDPGYPIYSSLAAFVGAKPVLLPLRLDGRFSIDLDRLRSMVTPRTRLIVLNSPSNPTGGVLERAALEAVAELAIQHDLWVLSDEIYSDIVFEGQFESILSLPGMAERTVVVGGFSKTYAMTGWRLGYGVMPAELARHLSNLMLNTLSATTTFVQMAGVTALHTGQPAVDAMLATLRLRRERMVAGLNQLPGVECLMPSGAFYAFPRFNGVNLKSAAVSRHLLDTVGVVTYPGSAFGDCGEGFIRFSFACSEATIDHGLALVDQALRLL